MWKTIFNELGFWICVIALVFWIASFSLKKYQDKE